MDMDMVTQCITPLREKLSGCEAISYSKNIAAYCLQAKIVWQRKKNGKAKKGKILILKANTKKNEDMARIMNAQENKEDG